MERTIEINFDKASNKVSLRRNPPNCVINNFPIEQIIKDFEKISGIKTDINFWLCGLFALYSPMGIENYLQGFVTN